MAGKVSVNSDTKLNNYNDKTIEEEEYVNAHWYRKTSKSNPRSNGMTVIFYFFLLILI